VKIVTVLKTGGDYGPEHVYWLKRQVNEHLPGHDFWCLTDAVSVPYRVPLQHDLPGWWSKMEVCRPDITGTVFYLDLDTVILRDLEPLVRDQSQSIVLRDVLRGLRNPQAVQSSVMLLTERHRALVWDWWVWNDPQRIMQECAHGGDQLVYERVLKTVCSFWQDTHPGMVQSYKVDLDGRDQHATPDASLVVFHGTPRPWDVDHAWVPKLYAIA